MELVKRDGNEIETVLIADFIGIKGYKAKGKRLSNKEIKSIKLLDPLPYTPPVTEDETVGESNEEIVTDAENESNSEDTLADPDVVRFDEQSEIDDKPVKKDTPSKKNPPDSLDDTLQMEIDFE